MHYIHVFCPEEDSEVRDYYFELNDFNGEERRLERWVDGHVTKCWGIREGAIPSVEEHNEMSGNDAREMTEDEFEMLWQANSDVPLTDYRHLPGYSGK